MKLKRTIAAICILYLLSIATYLNGQATKGLNTAYFELGGNGLFTSVNYERQFFSKINLNIHAGAGIYPKNGARLTIPVGINYLFPRKVHNSWLELGFGAVYCKADVTLYAIFDYKPGYVRTNFIYYVPSVGIRKLTENNQMFRVAFTPVIIGRECLPYFGVSIGQRF